MFYINDQKWTCPRCNRTVTINGNVAAEQTRHAKAHRDADLMKAHYRKTDVNNPAKQYGK